MKKIIFPDGHSALQLTILLVGLGIMFSGCVAHKYSRKVKGESMSLRETNNSGLIRYAMMKPQHINDLASRNDKSKGILNPLPLISIAVDGIVQLINSEKKKYTATYQNSGGQCYFYDQISEKDAFDPIGMQFDGFTFLRLIKTKKNKTNTAVYDRFSVDLKNPYEIINNSAFSLKLDELKIKYSKAKIMAIKWFEPWSWFMASRYPKLNMDFEIIITSSWVTSGGSIFDNIPIGRFYLNLRNIPMVKADPAYKLFYDSITKINVRGRSFLVPRSYGYYYNAVNQINPSYGQGIYNIVVNVTESSRSTFVNKLLYENAEPFIRQASTIIQLQKTSTQTKKTTK